MRMHSAKGHMVVNERWRFELAVAAACRAFAPRPTELLSASDVGGASAQPSASEPRYISYYSYRYL